MVVVLKRHRIVEEKILRKRSRLVLKYRVTAQKMAKNLLKKWRAHLPAEDLKSLVDLSLCEAAARFSLDFGTQFPTYLFYFIRGNLIKTMAEAQKGQRLVNLGEDNDHIRQNQEEATGLLFPMPGTPLSEYIENRAQETWLLKKEKIRLCKEAKVHLTELERQVLERVYFHDMSIPQVASHLGRSSSNISRLKKRALSRLHRKMSSYYAD